MANTPQPPITATVLHHEAKIGGDLAANETCDALSVASYLEQEIAQLLGADFVAKMPAELLEAFCLATVDRNHPTAELLYKLVINFMIAYASSSTNEDALKAFDYLDYLSDK